jgi:hypothetical protein
MGPILLERCLNHHISNTPECDLTTFYLDGDLVTATPITQGKHLFLIIKVKDHPAFPSNDHQWWSPKPITPNWPGGVASLELDPYTSARSGII